MSIKGNGEELFVGKKASNIFTADGKRTAIPYQSLKKIEYCLATPEQNGKLTLLKFGGITNKWIISAKAMLYKISH